MTDERDPTLEAAWRAQSRETTTPALDDKILAAAHRAVASRPHAPQATRPQQWWMPLAAAAVIGVIAIGLVQLTPPDLDTTVSQAPPATNAPVDAVKSIQEDKFRELQKKQKEADAASTANVQPATPPPAPDIVRKVAPAPKPSVATVPVPEKPMEQRAGKLEAERRAEPFPAAPPASRTEAMEENKRANAARDAATFVPEPQRQAAESIERKDDRVAGAAAPPPAAAPAPIAQPQMAARMRAQSDAGVAGSIATGDFKERARDPDAWIARIRKLRDDGNVSEALRELREFRALVADAEKRLPPDLRDWKP
jgi:hypothetical protein